MAPDYNPNAVWTSKKKKYDYQAPITAEKKLAPQESLLPEKNSKSSGGGFSPKKIGIIAGVAIFVIAVLGGVVYFLTRPAPAPAVALDFAKPASVSGGNPFTFSVLYTNS